MKKLYFSLMVLMSSIASFAQVVLPLDFEQAASTYVFTDFGGGAVSIIPNTQISGINTSNQVGKMIKFNGQTYGGSFISLSSPMDFSVNKTFKMKVFSPRVGAKALLKVENQSNAAIYYQKEVLTTVANAWEDLSFDFTAISTTNQYQKVVLIFDNGTMGDGSANFTYLFDDIRLTSSTGPVLTNPVLPLDFESATTNYAFTDFDGGTVTVMSNPQSSGINTSTKVAQMIKNAGQLYGGSFIELNSAIDFSVNKTFKMKVWSPRVGAKVLLKVENITNAAINFEKEVTTTVANTWEDLSFDYSAISTTDQFSKVVLIFDNGTMGDGSPNFTFYFDDLRLTSGGTVSNLAQMNLPVTFDNPGVDYGLIGFNGAEQSSIVTDPTLSTNKVAQVIKTVTASTTAGTTISSIGGAGFANKIPFSFTYYRMNVRVWSPDAGIPVRLKVEDHNDPTHSVETQTTTTTAGAWQTLTFNFLTQASGTAAINLTYNYDKASIFFNYGVAGATVGADKTYYFDDVQFGVAGTTAPVLPLDFQSTTTNYAFTNFDGGAVTVINNTQVSGINTSTKVGKMIKSSGQTWAGSYIVLNDAIDFSTNKLFKMKVFAPRVGAKVLLKVENTTNGVVSSFEKEVATTVANAWEELTFDYTNVNTSLQFQKVVLIFDNGTMGDGSANFTYLFDDLNLVAGTAPLTAPVLPLDFESATTNYTFTDFDGGAVTVVANPQPAGINTSSKVGKMVKNMGQVYGGSLIQLNGPIDFSVNKTFKMKVWSPRVGAKVLLKVENATNSALFYEKEVLTTVANTWEELTFDYTAINTANQYQKVVLIFDNGTMGDGSSNFTFYFDDIRLTTSTVIVTNPILPLDFESSTINYAFTDFDGGAVTVVTNPQPAGINTSSKVGKMVKNMGQVYGGSLIQLNGPIDFSVNKTFKMKVWSPRVGAKVLLKVENATNSALFYEKEVLTTVANTWEELTFDYTAINTANQYQKVVLIFDNGTMGDGSSNFTFYFDDIRLTTSTVVVTNPILPLDFESSTINYAFTDFDGGAASVVANPQPAGVNTSSKVGKMVKNAGQPWGGSLIQLDGPIDFSVNKTFKMKVWSPRVGAKVLLKVENATNNAISYEKEVLTTVANAWDELTFDYTAINTANQYQKVVLIFDNGTMGDGSSNFTFYFDDIRLTTSTVVVTNPVLPLDFESSTINYAFTDFDGGAASVVANPQPAGINTSSKVGKMVKNAGQPWGGSLIQLDGPIDFSVNKTFKMKVWSPRVGAKVLLKVENATNNAISYEKEVLTTVANAWDELTFDYTAINTANQYQKVVLIFDNGTMGDGSSNFTFYFDDIRLTTSTVIVTNPVLPLDFESSTINYAFTDFDGGAASVVANPQPAGVNTSSKVGKMVKNAGQPWGGSSILLNGPIDFSVNKTFKMKVWSPRVGAKVLLKVENATNSALFYEKEVLTTVANAWEDLSFDYTAINTANQYQKLVFIFENGTVGDGSSNFTFYFDDIRLITAPVISNVPVLPLDFESSIINYAFGDFDGGNATVISNPQPSGIDISPKVARMIKNAGQPWGGSSLMLNTPIDFSINKTFKMKVWSPRVGVKVLLKVENATNSGINFEKEELTTVANTWEELTFDYSAINTSNQYQKLVFIFENGTVGDGSSNFTFYFDDVRLTVGGNPVSSKTQMSIPLTFDDNNVNYSFIGFSGAEQSSVVVDPTLSSNKVAKVVKTAAALADAGTVITDSLGRGFSNRVPFSINNSKMTVRVWSPDAGIKVRLKLEEHNSPSHSVETEATVTTASGWQTLTFDFSDESANTTPLNLNYNYDKATIYFNYGVAGSAAGEKTYYFDDLMSKAIDNSTNTNDLLDQISIRPNPFVGYLNIINENKTPLDISVIDMAGKTVKRITSTNSVIQINMQTYPSGMYILQLVNKVNGKKVSKKVIKSN